MIALPSAALIAGLGELLKMRVDALLLALPALGLITLLSGALHEDGLADTADGLGGGRDRDHALSIMKDSRIGTYGVVALILSFGIRAAALAALTRLSPALAALALLASACVSRAALVGHWRALPPARSNGVAAAAGRPEVQATLLSLVVGGLLFILLIAPACGLAPAILALVLAAIACAGFTRFVARKLAGHTGDTIGATQQICESSLLLALALAA